MSPAAQAAGSTYATIDVQPATVAPLAAAEKARPVAGLAGRLKAGLAKGGRWVKIGAAVGAVAVIGGLVWLASE